MAKNRTQAEETGLVTADDPNELAAMNANELPEYMREYAGEGTEHLGQYFIPPRIKVVQRQSSQDLLDLHPAGTIVVVPSLDVVAAVGKEPGSNKPKRDSDPFTFIPLFQFTEYGSLNPREKKDLPMFAARSSDPKSDIALKARDADRRKEPFPGDPKLFIRHVEFINFIVIIEGVDAMANMPVLLSFSKGGHRDGCNLATMAKMAKGPLCGRRYVGQATFRSNTGGDYHSIQVTNPPAGTAPWVGPPAYFQEMLELSRSIKETYIKGQMKAEYEDPEENDPGAGDSPGKF